jgi:hypothetical protein
MRPLRIIVLACLLAGCGSTPQEKLVPLDSIPPAVLETARNKLPDVEFKQALKRTDDRYEIRGKDKTGKVHTIDLTASGEVLDIERPYPLQYA